MLNLMARYLFGPYNGLFAPPMPLLKIVAYALNNELIRGGLEASSRLGFASLGVWNGIENKKTPKEGAGWQVHSTEM